MKIRLLLPVLVMALAAGCGQGEQKATPKEAAKEAPKEAPAATLTTGGGSGAPAALQPPAPENASAAVDEHRIAMMQKALNLTPDQVDQMKAMQASGASKKELLSVLTDEQRQQWKSRVHNRKSEKETADQRIEDWQKLLNLDDAQVEKMRAIAAQGGGPRELRAVLTVQQLEVLRKSYKSQKTGSDAGPAEG